MINIYCVRVGTKYNISYMQKLYNGISRNLTKPFNMYCLTDDLNSFVPNVKNIDISYYVNKYGLRNYFAKLLLFNPEVIHQDRIFFFDLDTIIVGNIDEMFNYNGKLAILHNFYHRITGDLSRYGSAIMGISIIDTEHIWTRFINDIDDFKEIYKQIGYGDQSVIEELYPDADYWQDIIKHDPDYFRSFKIPVIMTKNIPKDCRIICFHGTPSCEEMKELQWMKNNWK